VHDREDRAQEIAERQARFDVVVADATDPATLASLSVGKGDAVAALTRSDSYNIMSCLIGKAMGASTTLTRYNRLGLFDLITAPGIDAGVSSEVAAANEVLRFVRRGDYLSAVSFMTGDVEAMEIELRPEAAVVGKAIGELDRPDGMVIGAVLRNGKAVVPRGATRFAAGDRVVVFATPGATGAVEKQFTV
jgi:trk/ktr system potassium uptake protein